jgi:pyridinium-3,5-biscarboxylic acid mononucleotide sulfurtransferase
LRALKELSVKSPLAEAGLTKNEIRELLKKEGLPLWNKPAMACLLTRIPYETEVSEGMLRMIGKAEDYLFEMGYPGTRVRLHGDIARIECLPGYLGKIINDPQREQIVANLKELGFRYITLDLEGYRTGSMDPETLEK